MQNRTPYLIDTTLRDGMQAVGVNFSRSKRLAIARKLSELGIQEIEAGTPAIGTHECADIRAVNRLHLSCAVSVWCRAMRADLDAAYACNVSSVHISFPVSSILLSTINKPTSWLFDTSAELIEYAKRSFSYVSIGCQDAMRTDIRLLRRFAQWVEHCGANRIRLADTVGVAMPFTVAKTVDDIVSRLRIPLGFHAHNDLGMATANTIMALHSGATVADVTVNGLGERAGNAALEEVVMAVSLSSRKSPFKTSCLSDVCAFVAKASHRRLRSDKSISGSEVFTHESGIHVAGLLKHALSYQPFTPDRVGRSKVTFISGYHAGKAGIQKAALDLGKHISSIDAQHLAETVRTISRTQKKHVSKKQFLALLKERAAKVSKRIQ